MQSTAEKENFHAAQNSKEKINVCDGVVRSLQLRPNLIAKHLHMGLYKFCGWNLLLQKLTQVNRPSQLGFGNLLVLQRFSLNGICCDEIGIIL